MKKNTLLLFIFLLCLSATKTFADGSIPAFIRVGTVNGTIEGVSKDIKTALQSSNFEIKGEYRPEKNDSLYLIAFTRKDLLEISIKDEAKNIAASVLRVGLRLTVAGKIEITLLNPEYIFYGYLREKVKIFESELSGISNDVKIALSSLASEFKPFGAGSITESELKSFRYMVRMPSYDDAIVVAENISFEQTVAVIERNLMAQKNGAYKVYEINLPDRKIAIFGVGLLDYRIGEAFFLNALGRDHFTAMPYELIVDNNKVIMLDGNFRFPFFWSDLPMIELRKVNRTARDIEYVFERLTK